MSLKGRVAIVTGSGGGLGARACAVPRAAGRPKLVVNDLGLARHERVAAEIVEAGGEAIAVAGSVTDEARRRRDGRDRDGRAGAGSTSFVNNAGILRDKSFAKMSIDDFRLVVDVHLMGAAICSKAVWEIMREQRYGRIVMTTSSSGLVRQFRPGELRRGQDGAGRADADAWRSRARNTASG